VAISNALTVGIVGVGQVATDVHLPVLLGMPGVRVAWIVDTNQTKADLIARAIGIEPTRLTQDLAALPNVDIALLAIPYGARRRYYEHFSGRETAVYAEKPFAASKHEHDQLVAMFPAHRLACGFQRRSSAVIRRLQGIVAAELFGRLMSARVEYGGPGTRGGNYYSNLGLAGGGILFEVGVHALDAVLFPTCANDTRPKSIRMVREQGFDVHTEATIEVDTEAGATFDLEVLMSSLVFTAMTNVYRFEHATLRHAVVEEGDPLWVSPTDGGERRYRLDGEFADYPRTNAQQLHEHWSLFLDAVRSGQPNYTNASATALTSSLIGQLYAG
jgi:predicted dehydrogenase